MAISKFLIGFIKGIAEQWGGGLVTISSLSTHKKGKRNFDFQLNMTSPDFIQPCLP